MPRVCTICSHPKRVEIDKLLIDGRPFRRIAAQSGVTEQTLRRHKRNHLVDALAATVSARKQRRGKSAKVTRREDAQVVEHAELAVQKQIDVMRHLFTNVERFTLLLDAVDKWLRDPDNPNRYDISPRADEIEVVYEDAALEGKRRKHKLSELLRRLEGIGVWPDRVTWRQADRCELLLKTGEGLKSQLSLYVDIIDKLRQVEQIDRFHTAVLDAINEVAPDVREAIEVNLRRRLPA